MALSGTLRRKLPPREAGDGASPLIGGMVAIWAAGLLIRLLLLPFTMHTDVYQIYSRAHMAAYHGDWLVWSSQIVIQMVHNLWLLLIRPLLPGSEPIWSHTAGVLGSGPIPAPEDLARFFAYPHLARALFLMKLPYLIADLATGYVLTRLVAPERRRRVLALWLLNPLVIFGSAIFARHDSMSVFLVVLSVLVATRGRRYLGLGLLGLGAVARLFPAFLVPFFILAYRRSRRELLLLGGGIAMLWLIIDGTTWAVTGSSPSLTILTRYPHIDYLVELALPLLQGDRIFIFPLAYALLFLWYSERHPSGSGDYVAAGAAVMLILFALTFFHPQYTVWLVPFLALTIDRRGELIGYHIVQIILLGLYALNWGTGITWDMLRPLGAPVLGTLPDPMTIIGAQVPAELFFGLVRSLFTAVTLWMAYRILRDQFGKRRHPVLEGGNELG